MGDVFTPEQVREKDLRDFGPDLGPVFHALSNEIVWLHDKWDLYCQLYGHSQARIDILSKAASHFAGVLQGLLWEDTLLSLARLTDPPKTRTGKKERYNLSLRQLPCVTDDPGFRDEIGQLVETVLTKVMFARDWRNRLLAHRDLEHALTPSVTPLENGSRASVKAALSAIREVMNRVEDHYREATTDYEHIISNGGDATSLLAYLRLGIKADERRRERLRQGRALPEDFERDEDV